MDFKGTEDDNNFSLEKGQLKEIIKRPELPWHLCPWRVYVKVWPLLYTLQVIIKKTKG